MKIDPVYFIQFFLTFKQMLPMKKILFLLSFISLFSCNQDTEEKSTTNSSAEEKSTKNDSVQNFGIVIHGGAGTILKENMSDSLEQAYKDKLEEAIRKGHEILASGGTAMEAVQRTINIMEDSPLFNSGKGAVFTNEGINELDASIMDGKNLNAGAVAGITNCNSLS